MKSLAHLALLAPLALAACGRGAPANQAETTTVDAVTAEAVSDTQAATADAQAAASMELDRIGNEADEASGPAANKADRVSSTTKVEVY